MTRGELIELLVREAKRYHKNGIKESITRNSHMNDYKGRRFPNKTVEAVLVDFVNFIAVNQGIDLGLYTKDLK